MKALYLCPAGNSRPDQAPERIGRYDEGETDAVSNHMGSGSHHTHLSHEDIKELWQFINIQPAQQLSNPGYTVIIFRSRPLIGFLITYHRAEFQALKEITVSANPFLPEKNRSF